MYSYALAVGISIVVSLQYSEAYVKCYMCQSASSPGFHPDCLGPDMAKVPTCVGATCEMASLTCSGTDEECRDFGLGPNSKVFVSRYCTNNTIDSDNCGTTRYTLATQRYCLCKNDLCNASPIVKAIPKPTLVFLIMSLYVVNSFAVKAMMMMM